MYTGILFEDTFFYILIFAIGIGSGSAGSDESTLVSLQALWQGVESLIREGKVGGAGFCDLRPSAFIALYDQADIKPTSVQVGGINVYLEFVFNSNIINSLMDAPPPSSFIKSAICAGEPEKLLCSSRGTECFC